jgi:TonB-dependent receptor
MKKNLLILFILILLISSGFSQGTLIGVLTDSLTGDPLIGANIYLQGTALGASTDMDGTYRIEAVPFGSYTMVFSYLGYRTKKIPVNVESKSKIKVNIGLIYDVIEGEEIFITAQAEGQAEAINKQITANSIINVVSEERIQELPDANAAEAVGRLPGVALLRSGGEANKVVMRGLSSRYSAISVDGVRMASTGGSTVNSNGGTTTSGSNVDAADRNADPRDVDLSTISQRSLAGIELYKALTSDQDGDAIAGALNFVTRKAPEKRLIRLDARGSYNGIEQAYDQYDFSLRYGERYFQNKLGLQLTGNLERRIRSEENYFVDYDFEAGSIAQTWALRGLSLNYRDETRKRGGFSALIDFETPDGGLIKINNIYNQTKRDFITYTRNYPLDEPLTYTARNQEQHIRTYNGFITGENYLLGLNLDWHFSYAQAKLNYPYDFELVFLEPSVLDANQNPASAMRNPTEDALLGSPEGLIPFAFNNFDSTYLYSGHFRGEDAKNKELSAVLNFSKKYVLGKWLSGQLKLGGKYRTLSRSRSRSEMLAPYYNRGIYPRYVVLPDGSIAEKNFSGTVFDNLQRGGLDGLDGNGNILMTNFLDGIPQNRDLFGKFALYPLVNQDALRLWWDLNQNGVSALQGGTKEFLVNLEPTASFYDIQERVSAGYIMNTFNFGRQVSFIAGVRVESENNDYQSKIFIDDTGYPVPVGAIRDTSAVHRETVWLPNFHLAVRPTTFMGIRLAVYEALARPDFSYRLNNFVAQKSGVFTGTTGNGFYIGNPGLQAAKAWNFELNTSFYEGYYGLLSVSAFYKDIKDMFHLIDALVLDQNFNLDSLGINYTNPYQAAYTLTYPYNSSKPTHIWGFEFEVQTTLRYLPGFLPDFLKNFVMNGNMSVIRSETYVMQNLLILVPRPPFPPGIRHELIETKQKLEDQPSFFGNLAIGYDIGGFSARLSVFHQGAYNRSFSPLGSNDVIQDSYTRWDLALKHQINRYFSVFLNINNIFNGQEGRSNINRIVGFQKITSRQSYGVTGDLGIRIQL